jgi:hypothetical protein
MLKDLLILNKLLLYLYMINTDLDIKAKFVEMCRLIFINSKSKFVFPFDDFKHDDDYKDFINHSDWSILKSKMKNLIKLVNKDQLILEKDVETEIWEIV